MFAIARESHLLRVELSAKILNPLGIRTDYKVRRTAVDLVERRRGNRLLLDYLAAHRRRDRRDHRVRCDPAEHRSAARADGADRRARRGRRTAADRTDDRRARRRPAGRNRQGHRAGHRPDQWTPPTAGHRRAGATRPPATGSRAGDRWRPTLRAARIQSVHAGRPRPQRCAGRDGGRGRCDVLRDSRRSVGRSADHRDRSWPSSSSSRSRCWPIVPSGSPKRAASANRIAKVLASPDPPTVLETALPVPQGSTRDV